MELKSAVYKTKIFHARKKPRENTFSYNIFMFLIDIDEMDMIGRQLRFVSYNKPNIFSFYDADHFKKSKNENDRSNTRKKLEKYLRDQGIHEVPARIELLTHLRLFNYVFNPVSFYYCYDANDNIFCVIAEVTNTYGEMKMYLLQKKYKGYFDEVHQKFFYISPFTNLDDYLRLKVGSPSEKLKVFIDDFTGTETKVKTVLTATKKALTDWRLIKYVFSFPLITLQIIFLIHWQALKLWLKGVKYIPKNDNPQMQKDIYYKKNAADEAIVVQKNSAVPIGQNEARPA